MFLVAYFLSRCGVILDNSPNPVPPTAMNVLTWKEGYGLFYDTPGAGRNLATFRNSLKNTRDDFDAHLENGRVGWRSDDASRSPQPLARPAQAVWDTWTDRSDEELTIRVLSIISETTRTESEQDISSNDPIAGAIRKLESERDKLIRAIDALRRLQ